MPQNATPSPLSSGRLRAVEALAAGKTVTESAKLAGVDRTTVHRWRREDFEFQAELNRQQRELHDAFRQRLLSIALLATETVSAAVEAGDVPASLQVLKGIGVLSGQTLRLESDDVDTLKEEAEIARLAERSDRTLRGMAAAMGP